jgi:predicted dehydrogenase
MEKPLARTYAEAKELAHAADHAQSFAMCAMCMRFWPGWVWLKEAVDEQKFGKLLGLSFRRVAQHPGGPFYSDGEAAGGAVLDLHIHDSDFVRHLLGEPDAVQTVGYSRKTSALDHVSTQYLYGADGPLVHAEGGWNMTDGFGFSMRYTANFERATADFDIGRDDWLHLSEDGSTKPVELPPGMGYEHEIRYFIDCIKAGQPPKRVSLADAAESVRLVEAEVRSAQAKGERASL